MSKSDKLFFGTFILVLLLISTSSIIYDSVFKVESQYLLITNPTPKQLVAICNMDSSNRIWFKGIEQTAFIGGNDVYTVRLGTRASEPDRATEFLSGIGVKADTIKIVIPNK